LRQAEFRAQLAHAIVQLGAADRRDRVGLYRLARGMVRAGTADLDTPRDRRGRTQALLELEGAIREVEAGYAADRGDQHRIAGSSETARIELDEGEHGDDRRAGAAGPARVLGALILRNVRMMFAKDPLAYLWLFLAPTLTIAVHFWAYTFLLGFGSVLDMPTLPFLVLGIGGWHMMRTITLKLGYEVVRDQNLARFRMIDTLTIAAAKAIELAFAYTAVVAIGLAWFSAVNGYAPPRNLLGVAYYWALLAVAGFGLGLLLNFCRELLPGISVLAMPLFRLGFFFSGVVVVSEQFPEKFRIFLVWNPVLHVMQLLRSEYFVQYRSQDALPAVAGFFALTALFLGCAAEASRRRRVAIA
jgi:capsular polysaccharide transport system permease protein